jgi:hypothetical protein
LRTSQLSNRVSRPSQRDYDYVIYSVVPERNRQTPRQSTSSIVDEFINSFLNPVNITPSQEQIQNSTTHMIYNELTNPLNTSCPISLVSFQSDDEILQINRCHHNYNPSSLLEWFRENTICPLCRIDIRDNVEL